MGIQMKKINKEETFQTKAVLKVLNLFINKIHTFISIIIRRLTDGTAGGGRVCALW